MAKNRKSRLGIPLSKKLEREISRKGFVVMNYRLLQLLTRCVFYGSGNMTRRDKLEMMKLMGRVEE